MKKLFLPILVFLMLAATYAHGMAGYAFHFDAVKPSWSFKELLQPDRFYTEHIQPEDTRPSKHYVDDLYEYKRIMGIQKPITLKKATIGKNELANATNYGFLPFGISIIRLDEKKMAALPPVISKPVISHELEHARLNHNGEMNFWSYTASFSGYFPLIGSFVSYSMLKMINSIRLLPLSLIPMVAALKLTDHTVDQKAKNHNHYLQNKLEIERKHEYEAEQGSFSALAKKGDCSTLQDALNRFKYWQKYHAYDQKKNVRHAGEIYPTYEEYIALTRTAYRECLQLQSQSKNQSTQEI